ncbi:MAG: hypothetical protein IJ829_02095, partial [Kiritimatiellae bacterium]|nr:hypothetical protein [Kiritimatiellia bacterium]
AAGARWPFLREMTWSFPLTAAATVGFLALGTAFLPDDAASRAAVDGFFKRREGDDADTA